MRAHLDKEEQYRVGQEVWNTSNHINSLCHWWGYLSWQGHQLSQALQKSGEIVALRQME